MKISYVKPSLIDQIEQLVAKSRGSSWFFTKEIDIFIRSSMRRLPGAERLVNTIDLANMTVHKTGTGVFTKLLGQVEQLSDKIGKPIFIENVQTEQFASFFERRGYTKLADVGIGDTPCFFRMNK